MCLSIKVLHLQGANAALEILKPPSERSEQEMLQWLLRMQYSQSAIYSALSLPSNSMLEELRETRLDICTTYIFDMIRRIEFSE